MSTNTDATAVVVKKPQAQIRAWLNSDALKNQIAQALPAVCKPERFMRTLATAIQKTPKLMSCSQASLFQAFMTCSELGIEPDGRRAHLIPYGTTCQLIIDYKGLIELIKRNGDVQTIFAEKVCENDKFSWANGEISHEIDWRNERGVAFAFYATATFKDGSHQTAVMQRAEVDSIRKRSRAANSGPWVTDYDEMAKKTVIRRLSKMLVLSPELHVALEASDAAEFEDIAPAEKTAESVLAAALDLPTEEEAATPTAETTENA